MDQKIFSAEYVNELYAGVTQERNLKLYTKPSFPFEKKFPRGETGIPNAEVVKLLGSSGRDSKDFENTVRFYSAFRSLTPTQASDARLWTYLTHVTYWDYMRKRWPIDGTKESIGRIKDRYFLASANIATLTRNGISRLWWYGHLTHDEKRKDPWELTRILLSRADLATGITERTLGSSKTIIVAMLGYLQDHLKISSDEKNTREFLKRVNMAGGVRVLPSMTVKEVREVLEAIRIS